MWHELGHMWYGAMVTNKWWGETWLKEAFADYLTYHTQAKFEETKLAYSNVDQKEFYMILLKITVTNKAKKTMNYLY